MKGKPESVTLIGGLHPSMEHALLVVDRAWRKYVHEHVVVTGAQEIGHSEGSRHYGILHQTAEGKVIHDTRCMALDFRTRDLTGAQRRQIAPELLRRLGEGEYDIVWEETHLHIEVDPKLL